MAGLDLAQVVTRREPEVWTETEWQLGIGYGTQADPQFHVVAYDFGVKRNILRLLADRGCELTVVPAQTPASAVLKLEPQGVFLSNGPGDPEPCDYAIAATRELVERGLRQLGERTVNAHGQVKARGQAFGGGDDFFACIQQHRIGKRAAGVNAEKIVGGHACGVW